MHWLLHVFSTGYENTLYESILTSPLSTRSAPHKLVILLKFSEVYSFGHKGYKNQVLKENPCFLWKAIH